MSQGTKNELLRGYVEPSNLEEAKAERARLSLIVQTVNSELAQQRKSRSMIDTEYDRWRAKQMRKLAEVTEKLQLVKSLIHKFATAEDEEKRKACLLTPIGAELVIASKKASNELWDYIRALEQTIESLKLENDVLKHRVHELTTNAPGDGWDEWRDRPTAEYSA